MHVVNLQLSLLLLEDPTVFTFLPKLPNQLLTACSESGICRKMVGFRVSSGVYSMDSGGSDIDVWWFG